MRPAPLLLLLAACAGATPPAAPTPDLKTILERLDADEIETREAALRELVELGPRVLPDIEEALGRPLSPEVRARLEEARDCLRGVQVVLGFEKTRIAAGERFQWSALLVNRQSRPAVLVQALPGSGHFRRFPAIDLEVQLEDGTLIGSRDFEYCHLDPFEPLKPSDLVPLEKGQALVLFEGLKPDQGKVLWFDSWMPAPGRYRARLVYDSSPADWLTWIQDEPMALVGATSARAAPYATAEPDDFSKVHHARILSDWVDLVVE